MVGVIKMSGYIKLYRKLLDSAVFQNEKVLKVWIWCLLKATHKEHEQLIGLQKVALKPGQFIFGRDEAAKELKLHPSTLYRYMQLLKNVGNLNIKPNNKFSLVTLENWGLYQANTQEVNNKRTTNEQQMNTNKNVKNEKNKDIYSAAVNYLNQKAGTNYKPTTKTTQRLIDARLNDDFTDEDFITVIDKKVAEWRGTDMAKYLRPETLFGAKFESYLNQSDGIKINNPDGFEVIR
jgi:uncharacterized phage protein (TIGR02220 family)